MPTSPRARSRLDDGWKIPESTIIVEYLDTHVATGTRLIPEDRDQARQTRFHDRVADLYVTEPLMALHFERGDAAATHARATSIRSIASRTCRRTSRARSSGRA